MGFLKKPAWLVLFWVLLFFGVLLILALPITGFYWVLLGFFAFLNEFLDVFDFCLFELFLILALFITRFFALLWCFIRFYWVFSLFLNDFGAIFKKTQKNPFLVGFFDWAFLGFFGRVFLGWVFLAIPEKQTL